MTANRRALRICRQCGAHRRDRTLGEQRCLPGAPRLAFCRATASCSTPRIRAGSRDDSAASAVDVLESSESAVDAAEVDGTGLAAEGPSVSPGAVLLASRPSSVVDMTDAAGTDAGVEPTPPAPPDITLR